MEAGNVDPWLPQWLRIFRAAGLSGKELREARWLALGLSHRQVAVEPDTRIMEDDRHMVCCHDVALSPFYVRRGVRVYMLLFAVDRDG